MGLTEYHHGMLLVTAVSFAVWLGLNASTTCFSALIAEGYDIPPDARLGVAILRLLEHYASCVHAFEP